MEKISFIMPSRNGKKYLEWAYNSIRKNLNPEHEICMYDDASIDGTWKYINELKEKDNNIQIFRNEGPERVGHTISYDFLVDKAKNEICMIFHNDMYACPGLDEAILKHLSRKTIVSATRIEPPLHPPGPEKIIKDFGIEIEEFDEKGLLNFVKNYKSDKEYTKGIFAPWIIYKKDFQSIGGHDSLFAPQSKEDSDIFNRFLLNGYKFIQPRLAFVYHMTCRGSRFKDGVKRNPNGKVFIKGRESNEWLIQNMVSTRNFIRKWGSMVKHDNMLYPIISHKYDIGFIINNCNYQTLELLEPWCNNIKINNINIKNKYINKEQKNTIYNLNKRIIINSTKLTNDIIIEFDNNNIHNKQFNFIQNLSDILTESGEIGKMEYDIFKLIINKLNHYEKNLIYCNTNTNKLTNT